MPNGKDISAEEFVKEYSDDYFLKKPGVKGLVPGLKRSSEFVEKTISAILRNGIQDEQDVARILAWKIGKIRHRDSQNSGTSDEERHFEYSKDWVNAEKLGDVWLYCKDKTPEKAFPLKDITSFIAKKNENNELILESLAKNNRLELLNTINDYIINKKIQYFGTVYIITLLYFLSRGETPIYDKYAMMALDAICSDTAPKENGKVYIKYNALPSNKIKDKEAFNHIISCRISEYEDKIKTVYEEFGDQWKRCRKFDQALWVYGHLFTDDKKSLCC